MKKRCKENSLEEVVVMRRNVKWQSEARQHTNRRPTSVGIEPNCDWQNRKSMIIFSSAIYRIEVSGSESQLVEILLYVGAIFKTPQN